MHASLGDIMLDLVQNAIEAEACRIEVTMIHLDHQLSVCVADNGTGMDEATLARATDPFFTSGLKHKKRRFGLGLPFLKQQVEATGGTLDIHSVQGSGTTVSFNLNMNHVDAPPMPDLPEAVVSMMNFDGAYELVFQHRSQTNGYSVSRADLLEALDGMKTAADVLLARQYLVDLENDFLQKNHGEEPYYGKADIG